MSDAALSIADRHRERVRSAFLAKEMESLAGAFRLRVAALVVVALWLAVEGHWPSFLFYEAFLPLFAVNGGLRLWLYRAGYRQSWTRYLTPVADVALITFIFFAENPLAPELGAPGLKLRLGNQIYYFVLIAGAMAHYAPRVVYFTGAAAALGWVLGASWTLAQPGVHLDLASPPAEPDPARAFLALQADPNAVIAADIGRTVIVILIVSGILGAIIDRARRLVYEHASAERERGNLARYFSPNMVEDLARKDEPLGAVRTQQVAVLFVDIVGFTRLSERAPPEQVIALLREFHARMERAVFAHRGTLDKFLGDGVMATFGTPWPGPADATNALRAALDMADEMARWNALRRAVGAHAIEIGVGVHYGAAVLGDIGGVNRLEFAVIGDTVNVAARLERLTRELGAPLTATGALIEAARAEGASGEVLARFRTEEPRPLPGRAAPVPLWSAAAPA